MSTISTEELYYGEKYHVFGRVCEELLTTRKPDDYDAQTWLELLLVKHAALAMLDLIANDDTVMA